MQATRMDLLGAAEESPNVPQTPISVVPNSDGRYIFTISYFIVVYNSHLTLASTNND